MIEAVFKGGGGGGGGGYFDRKQRRRQYFEGQRVININKTDKKAYLQKLEQATVLFQHDTRRVYWCGLNGAYM